MTASASAAAAAQVTFLGIFAADLAFRAPRLPHIGETLLGSDFAMGAGGKGSNQAIACARSGAQVALLTRIGRDVFGDMAIKAWRQAEINTAGVELCDESTGVAFIFVDQANGQNAIIVEPGAARGIDKAFVDRMARLIAASRVFATQLELPVAAAMHGLQIARSAGATTVFNPAPATAAVLPDAIWGLCDVVVPNEVEASMLTGIEVDGPERAALAADALIAKGAGNVIVTLGGQGALLRTPRSQLHIQPFNAGILCDTTGAGDAFIGGLCTAISEGRSLAEAARFASAVAGLSVTRPGTATSMPTRAEIDRLLGATDRR